ncbi:MAG: CBS domain-containing protein [archaeon]
MVYFNQLKGCPILDAKGKKLGTVKDFIFLDGKNYAEVTHIVYTDEEKVAKKIPWRLVGGLVDEAHPKRVSIAINLTLSAEDITPFLPKKGDLFVSAIIDKQVVDVDGVKVVRVNDIVLGKVDYKFCVVAVAVGMASLAMRLGLQTSSDSNFPSKTERIIPWKSVQRLEPDLHDLHLSVQKSKIEHLHPEDIADLMEDLTPNQRILVFSTLDEKKAAKTLLGAEDNVRDTVLKSLKRDRILDILESISEDKSADVLSLMTKSERGRMLNAMKPTIRKKVMDILKYPEESAAAIMTTEFISVPESYTVMQTLQLLRKRQPKFKFYYVYVLNKSGQLVGVLGLRNLLLARPSVPIASIMNKQVIHVKLDTPKESIAKAISRYELSSVPVVDNSNVLNGVVRAYMVVESIIPKKWKRERYHPHTLKHKAA